VGYFHLATAYELQSLTLPGAPNQLGNLEGAKLPDLQS
jgi:hypothetical protein